MAAASEVVEMVVAMAAVAVATVVVATVGVGTVASEGVEVSGCLVVVLAGTKEEGWVLAV